MSLFEKAQSSTAGMAKYSPPQPKKAMDFFPLIYSVKDAMQPSRRRIIPHRITAALNTDRRRRMCQALCCALQHPGMLAIAQVLKAPVFRLLF